MACGAISRIRNSLMSCVRSRIRSTTPRYSRTRNNSSGMTILRSLRTLHWQLIRTLSPTSCSVSSGSSVGPTGPPPSTMRTLQYAQVPRPPHADGMKMPSAFRAASSGSPPSLSIVLAPALTSMRHTP